MSSFFPAVKKKYKPLYLDNINDILDDFSFFPRWSESTWSTPAVKTKSLSSYASAPRANVTKNEGGYGIELAVPGFSRDDFRIEVESDVLSISMENKGTSYPDSSYVTREYNYNSFTRSWTLPEGTNAENISARYDAGVLTVDVPVEEPASTKRRIDVG